MPEYRILVTGPSWIGDMVMAQSLFRLLHEKNQHLSLDVLAPEWVFPLLKRMPEVNAALKFNSRHGKLDLWKRIETGRNLKGNKYHEAIIIPRSLKSAIPSFFANIPKRTGFSHHLGLINHVTPYKKSRKELFVRRYLALASTQAYSMSYDQIPKPALETDAKNLLDWLNKTGLQEKNYIVLAPGAEFGPSKQWGAKNFAQLADLIEQKNMQVCLVGSNKDKKIGQDIMALSRQKKIIDLTGKTGLADVIDIMSAAKAAVCNDSGLMHIAVATQTAVVAIYGSTSPEYTPPLGADMNINRVIASGQACSPCFKRNCRFGHYQCLMETKAQSVAKTLFSLF